MLVLRRTVGGAVGSYHRDMDSWTVAFGIGTLVTSAVTAFGGGYLGVKWSAKQRRDERLDDERRQWRGSAAPVLAEVHMLLEDVQISQVHRRHPDDRARIVGSWVAQWAESRPRLLALALGHPDEDLARAVHAIDFHTCTCMDYAGHGATLIAPGTQPSPEGLTALLDALRSHPRQANAPPARHDGRGLGANVDGGRADWRRGPYGPGCCREGAEVQHLGAWPEGRTWGRLGPGHTPHYWVNHDCVTWIECASVERRGLETSIPGYPAWPTGGEFPGAHFGLSAGYVAAAALGTGTTGRSVATPASAADTTPSASSATTPGATTPSTSGPQKVIDIQAVHRDEGQGVVGGWDGGLTSGPGPSSTSSPAARSCSNPTRTSAITSLSASGRPGRGEFRTEGIEVDWQAGSHKGTTKFPYLIGLIVSG